MMKKILTALILVALLAVVLPPLLRNSETGPLDTEARRAAPGQFVELSQGFVHYRLRGPESAPLVVFIHGFSVPSYTWERNAGPLAERGFRTLTYDLYGRGWSDRPDLAYDRDDFVGQLAGLLDALAIDDRVDLVGVSMGGAIAAAFAAEYPQRVNSVVLLAPFNQPIEIGALDTPLLGDYLAYTFFIPDLAARQLEDFADPSQYAEWPARFRRQMQFTGFRRALLATARGYLQSDPMADFRTVGAAGTRVLLLWGDSDRTFPYEQNGPVRDALGPHAEFKPVRDAGHAVHYEQAEAVNRYLVDFLSRAR